jgi:hypothetical protein
MTRFQTAVLCAVTTASLATSRTIVVNNGHASASDANAGTEAAPLRTIQAAANQAQPGDLVLVHEGIYRERVTPPRGGSSESARITYQAAPGENVVISGADVWEPQWQGSAPVFYAMPPDNMFNDDVYIENKNPFKVKLYGADATCGIVLVDGVMYRELAGAVSPKSWYYNSSTGAINIRFPSADPSAHTVEISTRRRIFSPHIRGLGYITVSGFTMEVAGNQSSYWVDAAFDAALGRETMAALDCQGGHHWIIEYCNVRYSKGCGIDIGGYSDSKDWERNPQGSYNASYNICRYNIVSWHGQLGISTSLKGGAAGYNQVIGNYVEYSNCMQLTIFEEAGIKSHNLSNSVIADNMIVNTYGHWNNAALWLDYHSENNNRITRNCVIAPNMSAVYFEICSNGSNLFDNNIVVGNIRYREASGNTIANNFVNGTIEGGTQANNITGVSHVYNAATHLFTFTAPAGAFQAGLSVPDGRIQTDYFDRPYGPPVVMGPFQDLQQGTNSYTLWPKGDQQVTAAARGCRAARSNGPEVSASTRGIRVGANGASVGVEVLDLMGRRRHVSALASAQAADIQLPSGFYFVKISSPESGKVIAARFCTVQKEGL